MTERHLSEILRVLGRDIGRYGTRSLLIRVGQLGVLPVYMAFLSPRDFGILALASVYGSFVNLFLGFSLESAILRFYFEWPENERRKYVGSVWAFSTASAVLLTVIFHVVSKAFLGSVIRQAPYEPYLKLTLWTTLFTTLEAIPVTILRCRQEVSKYSLFTTGGFVLREGSKVLSLAVTAGGALVVLRAGLYASALMAVIYVAWMLRAAEFKFRFEHLRAPLRFAVPSIPGGMIDSLGTISDRFFLEKFVSIEGLGLYEVARKIANLVREANTPLKMAWVPYIIRLTVERSDAAALIGRLSSYYLGVLFAVALGTAMASRELLAVMAGGTYLRGYHLVVGLCIVGLVESAFTLPGTIVYVAKRTGQLAAASGISFAVLIASSWLFIPRFGLNGAIMALFVYLASKGLILFLITKRSYPVPYEWPRVSVMAALASGAFVAGLPAAWLPAWGAIIVKVGLVGLYAGLVLGFSLGGKRALVRLVGSKFRRQEALAAEVSVAEPDERVLLQTASEDMTQPGDW